jgi:2-succinyl-6-hydroxy-2,4-cyclohexadiene-1-carboxylate synthase
MCSREPSHACSTGVRKVTETVDESPTAPESLASVVSGPIDAPRLVLVHGFTQTAHSWSTIATDLAEDHRVRCVDAPGHGGSGHLRLDLWEAASALGATGGPATYIGYSMGGRLALHLAVAAPQLVERLVLIGVHAGLDDDIERQDRRDHDEELARSLERDGLPAFLDRWLAQALFAGLDPSSADREDRLRNTVDGLAASLRLNGTGRQEPLWRRAGSIDVPTLVLAGEHDAKFRAVGLRLVESIGENATFGIVPDAGHAVHLERPVMFTEILRSWLEATGDSAHA